MKSSYTLYFIIIMCAYRCAVGVKYFKNSPLNRVVIEMGFANATAIQL